MKKIFVSLLMLFITFSCETLKPPVKIENLKVNIDTQVSVNADVFSSLEMNEEKLEKYQFGFIYEINSEVTDSKDFKINENVINVLGLLNNDLSFSFVFNDLTPFDYILPITIKAYAITDKNKIIYSKEMLTFVIYHEALKKNTPFAEDIVFKVENISYSEEFKLSAEVDEEIFGFNVIADFKTIEEGNIYGIFYKYNATIDEQEDLTFKSTNYRLICGSALTENILKGNFGDLEEEKYFYDISFRSFVYNEKDKTFKFINKTMTTSLYDLALEDDSDFSLNVVNVVETNITIIKDIFINTDVTEEYQVGSHSEGIIVEMYYDFLIVRLTVTTKIGYKFSSKIKNENITILRVDDDIIVDEFTVVVSGFKLIIEYEDYGWGPPM